VELAGGGKRPGFRARRLGSSPVFQDRMGEAYLAVAGAGALLHAHAEQAWRQATAGQPLSPLEPAVLRATAAEVTRDRHPGVDLAYQLSSGSAVYDGASVQRRLVTCTR
jgi:alkylation response protein AidB-like acyl-CoA dehydrogenase